LDIASATNAAAVIESSNSANFSYLSLKNTGGTAHEWQLATGGSTSSAANTFYIYDATAAAVRVTLDTSGNLGLGVTPSAWSSGYRALDISSVGSVTSGSTFFTLYNNLYSGANVTYKTTGYATVYRQGQDNGQHAWFVAPSGTAGTTATLTQAMTLDNSGNLGIGTTPGTKLDIDSGATSGAILRIRSSSYNSSGLTFNIGTDASVGLGSVGAVPLFFNTNNTERMRIDSSGNLLIGVTSNGNSTALINANGTGISKAYSSSGNTTINTLPSQAGSGGALCVIRGYDGSSGNPYCKLYVVAIQVAGGSSTGTGATLVASQGSAAASFSFAQSGGYMQITASSTSGGGWIASYFGIL